MSDLFGIAKSGLQAYKESLATTGQNIANVGNENYARREANLTEVRSASADVLAVSSNISYGVKIDGITRAFDQFIDLQLQKATSGLSFATSQTLVLEKLEQVLRPSDSTVSTKLNDFFSALSTVSQDPSDIAARNISLDAARSLVSSITSVANGIEDIRELVADTLSVNVKDFNNTLGLLGSIQTEILGNSSPASTPNSLLDQRDAYLKTLSELADIGVEYLKNGSVKLTLGTTGQGLTLLNGLDQKKISMQTVDGVSNIFLANNSSDFLSKIQVQSGELAGNLAADMTLTETKKSLDELAKALVMEFNDIHRFGVDLNGDQGSDFFTLDAVEIMKLSSHESTSQLHVQGEFNSKMGQELKVTYKPTEDLWTVSNSAGDLLQEFTGSTELDGIRISIEGQGARGDAFTVSFNNGSSENLKLKVLDGRKLAAGSFYSVEPAVTNSSNSDLKIEKFEELRTDSLTELNSAFSYPMDATNAINFVSNGALGYLEDVDRISNLTTLKSQASIQFGVAITDLDANSKLKITLGTTEHTFSIGNYLDRVSDYREISELLNEGTLKSDTDSYSFSDLGLFSGGNESSLSVSSAAQPPYLGSQKLNSGNLNNHSGILTASDEGTAKLQIFTREGIHLSGEPLSAEEANQLLSKANGFTQEAKYSAEYIATGSDSNYIGAEISRITTSGEQTKTISGIGFSDNFGVFSDAAGIISEVKNVTDVSGAIVAFDGMSGPDASRFAGSYVISATDYTTSASGSGATFVIDLDTSGAATITMTSSGSGFVDDETITITHDKLGGGGGAPLTFDVNGIKETSDRVAGTYTIGASDYTTNGNGSGATFKVVIDSDGDASVIATGTGSGFVDGETVTITDSNFGGGGGSDFTFDIELANSFPSSRVEMPSDISINTAAGRLADISISKGMMAGQIANKINSEIGVSGVDALATNQLEIFDIPNGRIQFDLYGDSVDPLSLDLTISNRNTQELVSAINENTIETGIVASVSGEGAIMLSKSDGNDISVKNISISSGTLSARQIDNFGEVIQSTPLVIANGQHLISGGQVQLKSPSSFELTIDGTTESSSAKSFENGFINKTHNVDENSTKFDFVANSFVDGNFLEADYLKAVASSSSYKLTLSSDNANENIVSEFKPRLTNEFSSKIISTNLVSEIRGKAPQSRFIGDDFTLSDGFPENGSIIEFTVGEQDYSAKLNNSLEYTISGSNVIIGSESYSFDEALEIIVAASTFSISGPEEERLIVGFEQDGSNFRLFASARDGVLSGHGVVCASTNSSEQKNAFHISDTSGSEIFTAEFDLTQNDQSDFAELVIGSTNYSLSFETAADTITSTSATTLDADGNRVAVQGSITLPAGVVISLVPTDTNMAKMKIVIDESVDEKNIRLKATDNSATFGLITAGAQIVLDADGLVLSNYDNSRVTTISEVSSLADEVVSIEGMSGEDLIILSTGDRKPSVIGEVKAFTQELNPREMTVKVNSSNPETVDIFDTKSGDLLGSRTISSSNNFLFRDFDWVLNGGVSAGDEFQVVTSSNRQDDGTNLDRMIALSTFSESTGKGGYTEQYNSLITSAGYNIQAAEQNLINAKTAHDIALDRKSEFSGVDLDTEAAKLLEQQQAYQALARVLSTAKELLDTLLRSM